jgi:hypothetical protein
MAYDLQRMLPTGTLLATTYFQITGWMIMVVGFILVLYSRLHLVIINPRVRQILLPIILVVVIGTNILTFTITYVVVALDLGGGNGDTVYTLGWRLQLLSPIEEILLASLYVFFFIHFLKDSSKDYDVKKKTFYLLCTAQAVIISCDIVIVVITYRRLKLVRTTIYPFLYALKLEYEFMVLNYLVKFCQRREQDGNKFMDMEGSRDTRAVEKRDWELGISNTSVAAASLPLPATFSIDTTRTILPAKESMDEIERRYLGQYRYPKQEA